MKTIILHCAMLLVLVTSMAASCGSEDAEPVPDNFQSLLGRWKFTHFYGTFTQTDGSAKVVNWNAADRNINLYWEFKSDGEFIGKDDGTTVTGRWHLEVRKTDGTRIDEGTLTLSGLPEGSSMVDILGTEDLVFSVRTTNVTSEGKTFISLVTEVDASKARDGLKTIFQYYYNKE